MFNENYSELISEFEGFDRTMIHRFALGVLSEGLPDDKAEEALDVIKTFTDTLKNMGGGE